MWPIRLEPKLVSLFREGYSRAQLSKDVAAGVIVGIVALPLSIAFAIASGVKPEQGLFTAIIAGFLISVFSGSRVQIGGPTGAYIVIVYGIVQQYGYEGLALATFLAGIILLLMGLAGFGALIKFIPYPVTIGFTSGIALIIFSSQVKDLFGLHIASVPADFVEKWDSYLLNASSFNPWAVLIGALSLTVIFYMPRYSKIIPGSLVAIVVTTLLVQLFGIPVETIGSRFGSVPNTLPAPHMPELSWKLLTQMISPALTIAMLGAIESLLAAVVADGMTGRRHRSDMELVAQGIANLASPLFGGIPATGAIARTATNIKNGGSTPISGIVHALTLLLIMLFFGKLAALIPMATLAAILVVVSYHMSELRMFAKLFRSERSDVVVLLTTFFLTVLVDLTVAIQAGVVLAAFLFMRRMASVTEIGYLKRELLPEEAERDDSDSLCKRDIPEGIEVFEIQGPFFFGAADKFKDAIGIVSTSPRVFILRMRYVPVIDATGLRVLEDFHDRVIRSNSTLLLSGVKPQLRKLLERSQFLDKVGPSNVVKGIDEALERAKVLLSEASRKSEAFSPGAGALPLSSAHRPLPPM